MKISLIINTRNNKYTNLERLTKSAEGFDEIFIYQDGEVFDKKEGVVTEWGDGKDRSIKDGFNLGVSRTDGDFICCMCDDDFFEKENLNKLLEDIRSGQFDHADVIHFKVKVGGATWGSRSVSVGDLMSANCIPQGSFIRRSKFEEVNGYKIDYCADWNLWLRLAKAGAIFKNFNEVVYHYVLHGESATSRMEAELGGRAKAVEYVKSNL